MDPVVALKVDVDTERGTREGVPALVKLLEEFSAPATFLFSLGPDHTGRAVTRVFRPGFFGKVRRTGVVTTYGLRTLLNGTLFPGPHIGRRHSGVMRLVADHGFETGIHCYNHYRWQDHLFRMRLEDVRAEFGRARAEYERIFGRPAEIAGAAGWQANSLSKQVYDEAGLLYASDTRGTVPFFPRVGDRTFRTLEIPTTLPTLDELLGRPEYPDDSLPEYYAGLLRGDVPNVFTLHAEIEGMARIGLFRRMLRTWLERGVRFIRLEDLARQLLENRESIPVAEMTLDAIDGRSGVVAVRS